jgi:hypothetical protein
VILLTSDDARRVRVFQALDALCATPEARGSLRAWQTRYARSVGKECLLPAGESLVAERDRTSGWGSRGRTSLGGSATWKRDGSLASAGESESGQQKGVMSRLRMFSGRRSQMRALEMGMGGSVAGGSEGIDVGGRFAAAASEPGYVPAGAQDGIGQEGGGQTKMRVKRIRRIEHGY